MSNEIFAIGEIAILKNAGGPEHEHLNGQECQIKGHYGLYVCEKTGVEAFGYPVECPGYGKLLVARKHQLKKKRPPQTGYTKIIQMFGRTPRLEIA